MMHPTHLLLTAALFAAGCATSQASTGSAGPPASAAPSSAALSSAAPADPASPLKDAAGRVQIIVGFSTARPSAETVKDLEQRGFVVDRLLDRVEMVSGRIPQGALSGLDKVPGVKFVELDREVTVDGAAQHPSRLASAPSSPPSPSADEPGCPKAAPRVGAVCSSPSPSATETKDTIGTLGFCHYAAKPPMCSRACSCDHGHWTCFDVPCNELPGAPPVPPPQKP